MQNSTPTATDAAAKAFVADWLARFHAARERANRK